MCARRSSSLKRPSRSVSAPTLVPVTFTSASTMVSPVSSRTTPVMSPCFPSQAASTPPAFVLQRVEVLLR